MIHTAESDMPTLDRRKVQPWSFDRSINLPTILAFATLASAGLAYVRNQETRTTLLEAATAELRKCDKRLDEDLRALKLDIKDDLKEIKQDLKDLKQRR